jgi:hypothetical protein
MNQRTQEKVCQEFGDAVKDDASEYSQRACRRIERHADPIHQYASFMDMFNEEATVHVDQTYKEIQTPNWRIVNGHIQSKKTGNSRVEEQHQKEPLGDVD